MHQPIKHVLKSTKKLTSFREFAITPSAKDSSCGFMGGGSAFISPLKLKKLERRHGVTLLKGSEKPTLGGEMDIEDQDGDGCDKNVEEEKVRDKDQDLLKDNSAMDAYMKDLC